MTIPAGWYDDGSGNRRWWDGLQWTEHVVTDMQGPGSEPTAAETTAAETTAAESTVPEPTPAQEALVADAAAVAPGAPSAPVPPSAAAESAPFVPPYTLATQMPSAPAQASISDGSTYPAYAGSAAAPWPVAPSTPPAAGIPVVGIIGLVAVVIGVVCASIPVIAIAGWGLLAVGFVLSLVSLFLRGRKWPGITGLAVAVIGAVLAVAISFIVMATTSLSENDGGPLAVPSDRPPADGGSSSQGEDPSSIEGAEMVPFDDLEVGDCIPLVEYGDEDVIFELPVVPCDQPHTDEVYLIFDVDDDGEFPGDDALGVVASDGCLAAFEAYVGVSYDVSELDYYYYQPTKSSWARASDRTVQCILFSYEDVTGTLKDANR
jgi:hypothetical protein